jgi:protein involved in polysaccharide export with SLBB domain
LGGILCGLTWIALTGLLGGCGVWNDFFNPGEPYIISKGHSPLPVPILDTLGPGIEEPDTIYSDATDITPGDLVPEVTDYKIGNNDLVSISIFDLMGEGTGETVKTARVTETGTISLSLIPPVHAAGLTEQELEQAISKAYQDAGLIRNARVSVTVAEARARTFSIQGNVGQPGEYQITRPDFRMLDALMTARAPSQPIGVDFAYIIRKPPSADQSATTQPIMPSTTQPAPGDLLTPPPPTTPPPSTPQSRANPAPGAAHSLLMDQPPVDSGHVFKFDELQAPADVRVIRVPIDQLRQFGALKYNVVIRPGDMIVVPDPTEGYYYMGGHLLRTGVYQLSGFKVTLKQAWVAAGGADDFTIPRRTEIIRRVATDKEVFVRINMSKIWSGEQPDIYIKPNDTVEVGTDFIAPFLAAGRNSFRMTYGFGFLYDRNFYNGPNGF